MELQEIYIDKIYEYNDKTFDNGIDYVKHRRLHENWNEPVVFTTFQPILKCLEKPKSDIIQAIGHGYLQIPYTKKEKLQCESIIKPLNEIQLSDIKLNFCQLKSAFSESFHIFKGNIRSIKGSLSIDEKNKHDKIIETFEAFRLKIKKDYPDFPQLIDVFNDVIKEYKEGDLNSLDKIDIVNNERFASFLPQEENENNSNFIAKKPWKILFLDDNLEELSDLFNKLNGRIEVEKASTFEEARQIIEKDIYNQIVVIVSDYRLFDINDKSKPKRMLTEQGYDFIIWAAQQNRFNALVALSGLSKWFLMDSFRKNKLNVKVYSKSGLQSSGIQFFIEDLEYLGDQYYEILINQPKSETWKKYKFKIIIKDKTKNNKLDELFVNLESQSLINQNLINERLEEKAKKKGKTKAKDITIKSFDPNIHRYEISIENSPFKNFYSYHRNHIEYLSNEIEINSKAEKIAREFEYTIDHKSDISFASFTSLQGNTTKTLKGNYDDEYQFFLLKLLQRRVFYYLWLKGINEDTICKLLHKGEKDIRNHENNETNKGKKTKEDEISANMLKQIKTMLAIQAKTDIPYNLLVEEKYFLHQYMHMPIYTLADLMDQTFSIINKILTAHFTEEDLLKQEFGKYTWTENNELAVGCVSMLEVRILIGKIVNVLAQKSEKRNIIVQLLDDVIAVMELLNNVNANLNEDIITLQNLKVNFCQL